MKKFQQNMNRELKRQCPDRAKLEAQTISVVSFGGSVDTDVLDCPIWVLVLNIVAMEMLRSRVPYSKWEGKQSHKERQAWG